MTQHMDNTRVHVGTRVREARVRARLSQGELAAAVGLSRPSVSKLESGDRRVSADELVRLGEALGVGHIWLLGERVQETARAKAADGSERLADDRPSASKRARELVGKKASELVPPASALSQPTETVRQGLPISKKRAAQTRSSNRVKLILESTKRLLNDFSMDEITITMISEDTGIKRTAIYRCFPTIKEIYQAIAREDMMDLEDHYSELAVVENPRDWGDVVDSALGAVADFYNSRPAAMKTLLIHGSSSEVGVINIDYDIRYGQTMNRMFGHFFPLEISEDGEPFRTIVLMCVAFFSHSVRKHGYITPFFINQVKLISRLYLDEFTRRTTSITS